MIFGGALGNLFDRIYYSAVPDFIDFHLRNFHWFIFNVADIFITLGVICLILVEIILIIKKMKINNIILILLVALVGLSCQSSSKMD